MNPHFPCDAARCVEQRSEQQRRRPPGLKYRSVAAALILSIRTRSGARMRLGYA
jgi:hypothetical protein